MGSLTTDHSESARATRASEFCWLIMSGWIKTGTVSFRAPGSLLLAAGRIMRSKGVQRLVTRTPASAEESELRSRRNGLFGVNCLQPVPDANRAQNVP